MRCLGLSRLFGFSLALDLCMKATQAAGTAGRALSVGDLLCLSQCLEAFIRRLGISTVGPAPIPALYKPHPKFFASLSVVRGEPGRLLLTAENQKNQWYGLRAITKGEPSSQADSTHK